MNRLCLFVAAILTVAPAVADDLELERAERAELAREQAERRAVMIGRTDQLLGNRWQAEEVDPAKLSDDAEFLRRIYLDLNGVIPRVAEARRFLESEDPDKRAKLIDRLLESPAFATHMANTWRRFMLPGNLDAGQINNVVGVQNWLRSQFAENIRYDRVVGDLVVATGGGNSGPALFYTALDLEPEKLASNTARIFMGMQIECAQCHPHPFDKWTQEDFWGYAAFFAQLGRGESGASVIDGDSGEVMIPDTDTVVAPKYPGDAARTPDGRGTRRQQLAIWLASRDNPFLARAAVNRVWAHLFGRGIVEPVDDFSERNPPSHPELLQELSRYFVKSRFDMRELIRAVTNTKAYQLSSRHQGEKPPAPELFARMAIKTLNAEQLYDSVNRSLFRPPSNAMGRAASSSPLLDPQRRAFVARMDTGSRNPTEFESGVPQALTLMNGSEIGQATNQGGLLGALEAPIFNDQERVRILFLATLTRFPRDQEQSQFLEYVAAGGGGKNRRKAMGDVLWALLNSAEFTLNH